MVQLRERRRGARMVALGSIDEVRRAVTSCTACALCEGRTNAVPGRGDARARIMLVGEAPGRREDGLGEPFVGAAGQILDAALAGAGLSRDAVYITNTVKCRPPRNRVPTDAEREACSGYLAAEMALVAPRIVCIMGNTAYRSLLGGGGITRERGKTVRRGGVDYFLTVHPAAAIYNRALEGVLGEDMRALARIAAG